MYMKFYGQNESNTLKLQHTTYTDLEVNMRKMLLLINLSR